MSGGTAGSTGGRVLVVIVLFGRRLRETVTWSALQPLRNATEPLRLDHFLVIDNSGPLSAAADPPLDQVTTSVSPGNIGTAGAYAVATAFAQGNGSDWLLLLDQDTHLPPDYLDRAAEAIERHRGADVLVPRVWHGAALVSPAKIERGGRVRPVASPQARPGLTTAISSGVLVRTAVLAAVLPFPPEIWLDYVDHWMFSKFAAQQRSVGLIEADLAHHLSVRAPATLSVDRLRNILAAENAFCRNEPVHAPATLMLRRIVRAGRYFLSGHFALGATVVRHVFTSAPTR